MSFIVYFVTPIPVLVLGTLFVARSSKLTARRVGIAPGFLGINLSAAKQEFVIKDHQLVDEGYHKASLSCHISMQTGTKNHGTV